jgi:hypothetical protein
MSIVFTVMFDDINLLACLFLKVNVKEEKEEI